MRLSAAILAGGRATRMGGKPKPLLEVAGQTILARQLAVLAPLADEILVVAAAGEEARYRRGGVRVVADRRPDCGPLAGLEVALGEAGAPEVLVVGGDMPALHPAALALILQARPGADAVVPWVRGGREPLHARYARRLLPAISARLDRGERSLVSLLDQIDVEYLDEAGLRAADPTGLSWANVNTPEDLARLESVLRSAADGR